MKARDLVIGLLPILKMAGDYALQIQSGVQGMGDKGGSTVFQQALTDADLSVQSLVEVYLLSSFPSVAFYPEEADQSLNLKYFPTEAPFEVCLDPINGTQYYRDGLPLFDIIVTILQGENVAAAIDYIPARGVFYFAFRGQGAYTCTAAECGSDASWREYRLSGESDSVLIFDNPQLKQVLEKECSVIDMYERYQAGSSEHAIGSILTQTAGAFVRQQAHLIDWGAIAFIAAEAGGLATDFEGKFLPSYRNCGMLRVPTLIAAASAELHQRILRCVARL